MWCYNYLQRITVAAILLTAGFLKAISSPLTSELAIIEAMLKIEQKLEI